MTYRSEIFQPAECDANCDDPQCPYTHKPVLLRDAYDTLASENAALKEQLAAAEQARAVAEGNLELRSMSNLALRQLIGEMANDLRLVARLTEELHDSPKSLLCNLREGLPSFRDLISRARGAAS